MKRRMVVNPSPDLVPERSGLEVRALESASVASARLSGRPQASARPSAKRPSTGTRKERLLELQEVKVGVQAAADVQVDYRP